MKPMLCLRAYFRVSLRRLPSYIPCSSSCSPVLMHRRMPAGEEQWCAEASAAAVNSAAPAPKPSAGLSAQRPCMHWRLLLLSSLAGEKVLRKLIRQLPEWSDASARECAPHRPSRAASRP